MKTQKLAKAVSACKFPPDVVDERDREMYERGWRDRINQVAKAGGATKSPQKSSAARRNGRKGGKPRGLVDYATAVANYAIKHPGSSIKYSRTRLPFKL